jgi:hypothetical protein
MIDQTDRRIASAPAHYRFTIAGDARFAAVHGARTVREVEAYLPSNYSVMESFTIPPTDRRLVVVIGGVDDKGWTLDDYVIPRLASGMMVAKEIEAEGGGWDGVEEETRCVK